MIDPRKNSAGTGLQFSRGTGLPIAAAAASLFIDAINGIVGLSGIEQPFLRTRRGLPHTIHDGPNLRSLADRSQPCMVIGPGRSVQQCDVQIGCKRA